MFVCVRVFCCWPTCGSVAILAWKVAHTAVMGILATDRAPAGACSFTLQRCSGGDLHTHTHTGHQVRWWMKSCTVIQPRNNAVTSAPRKNKNNSIPSELLPLIRTFWREISVFTQRGSITGMRSTAETGRSTATTCDKQRCCWHVTFCFFVFFKKHHVLEIRKRIQTAQIIQIGWSGLRLNFGH